MKHTLTLLKALFFFSQYVILYIISDFDLPKILKILDLDDNNLAGISDFDHLTETIKFYFKSKDFRPRNW